MLGNTKIRSLDLFGGDNYKSPRPDMGSCGSCDWKGKVSDCETEMDSDGWEYPEYEVWLCPNCEEGVIIDWFFSESKLEEYEDYILKAIKK